MGFPFHPSLRFFTTRKSTVNFPILNSSIRPVPIPRWLIPSAPWTIFTRMWAWKNCGGAGVLNGGSSSETFNGSVRERSYFLSAASYTTLPPTIVNTDTVFGNSGVGTVNMSCDSTAISASLPGSMVPFSFS